MVSPKTQNYSDINLRNTEKKYNLKI